MPFGGALTAGVGIVSNIAGGLAGQAAGKGDIEAGKAAINDAYKQLSQIGYPPDTAKAIIFKQFQQKGLLTPELEQHINEGPSKMESITTDPKLKQAQMDALNILQQRGKGGLTPEDRAALNEMRNKIASDTEAKRQQILQNFAARGQGGSGAELIAALQGSQSGANQESQAGDRLAAMASQNALQSIAQAGTLGSQIRGQEFGEEAEKAKAADVINQFNTQNQINQQARNVAAGNQAQQYNLTTGQNIANANTQQANQELLRQNEAKRQMYLDTLNRATTINNAAQGYGSKMNDYASTEAQQAAAPWTGFGATAISAATPNEKTGKSAVSTWFYNGGEVPHYDEGTTNVDPHFYQNLAEDEKYRTDNYQQIKEGMQNQPSTMEKLKSLLGYNKGGEIPGYKSANVPSYHRTVTDFRDGGHVPGKAPMPGDHPKNDIVPAMLSPGEIVVPRSMAKSQFGKKLAKLLEQHHEVMKHAEGKDE